MPLGSLCQVSHEGSAGRGGDAPVLTEGSDTLSCTPELPELGFSSKYKHLLD